MSAFGSGELSHSAITRHSAIIAERLQIGQLPPMIWLGSKIQRAFYFFNRHNGLCVGIVTELLLLLGWAVYLLHTVFILDA